MTASADLVEEELVSPSSITLQSNAAACRRAYGDREREALDPALAARARADLRQWPGYAPTPLHSLPALASRLGVGRVFAKHEGARTELSSFKALGGAYSLSILLAREVSKRAGGVAVGFRDLEAGSFAGISRDITTCCASDGNHGRSLAWGARRFGCQCVIYLPASVSEPRADAIRRFGATVVRVDGNYDDAVHRAARDAAENGWLLVADTATPTYREPPQLVMAGYSLLMDEAWQQISEHERPTHVIAQAGCGGLAAVVASYVWARDGAERPTVMTVEPINAACVLETVKAGELAVVGGNHDTVMGGLACGEVSWLAWEVLEAGLDHALSISDDHVIEAVRGLANGEYGAALNAGESGAAGVGALLAIAEQPAIRRALGIDDTSRILVVITEGVTDPVQFEDILAGRRRA